MKLVNNMAALVIVAKSLLHFNNYKKKIGDARKQGNYELERKYLLEAEKAWSKELVDAFDINIILNGEENLPIDEPVVYILNHQSYFDVIALLSVIKQPTGFIAKKEFESTPVLGSALKRIRSIFIVRSNTKLSLKAIIKGIDNLDQGFSMVIFPEGTRSRSDNMGYFHKGSFQLATKKGYPIVPITVDGAYKIYEGQKEIKYHQTITLTVHERVESKGLNRFEKREIPEKVYNIIKSGFKKTADN